MLGLFDGAEGLSATLLFGSVPFCVLADSLCFSNGLIGFLGVLLDSESEVDVLLLFGLNVSRLPRLFTFCWKVVFLTGVDNDAVGIGCFVEAVEEEPVEA
jgi:hypothetical protein